ncbi:MULTISPECIES: hypothetical protein [Vibrio]|uniref:hypothetical protein n=1 Tax=Vibrio TaxID=662 RepID=UPI001BD3CB13|nr:MULTISPECIES: hypothetical protein [Vibrio]MBS9841349.1 hypothetical protein [Vibrio alginolyticus]MCI9716969.1 hypothetical protein [Vibrio parahaemolyticus]MCS0362948.1 hypothetical protein [Vibrio diabolicus]MDW1900139.1 hypothetical protein [Vibrio sp. Vb1337]HCM1316340.1 hypothetical protein [Vibrio parahaemolyticus]
MRFFSFENVHGTTISVNIAFIESVTKSKDNQYFIRMASGEKHYVEGQYARAMNEIRGQ